MAKLQRSFDEKSEASEIATYEKGFGFGAGMRMRKLLYGDDELWVAFLVVMSSTGRRCKY